MFPLLSISFFTSDLAQQLVNPSVVSTGNPFQVTSLMLLFTDILGWSIFFGALIAFICIIISGIEWMTAGGDTGSVQAAKSRITTCLIGFAVLATSYALFSLVQYFFGLSVGQLPGTAANGTLNQSPAPHANVDCWIVCGNNPNSTGMCLTVGTDPNGTNGAGWKWNYSTQTCELSTGVSCGYTMHHLATFPAPPGVTCGGRDSEWTYCGCEPLPTPTPISTCLGDQPMLSSGTSCTDVCQNTPGCTRCVSLGNNGTAHDNGKAWVKDPVDPNQCGDSVISYGCNADINETRCVDSAIPLTWCNCE